MKEMKKKEEKQLKKGTYLSHRDGITLVALVVTIVVLLILAGITITYVVGDNSVFKKASEAKLKADVASWQERLELAKLPIIVEGMGIFDPTSYFKYIEEQGIIENQDSVIDNKDGTYEITVIPGYVFEMELVPIKERPTDAVFEYLGKTGKLRPRIKNVDAKGKPATNSIDILVEVVRLEKGKLTYYYREATEDNSNTYIKIKETSDLTATISGLTNGKIYDIKVAVTNKNGTYELETKGALQQLVKEITLEPTIVTMERNKTLQLKATVLPENAENKKLEWSSNNEDVATVDENGLVKTKANGDVIITVKSTDGGEVSATCSIKVATLATSISLNKTTESVTVGNTKTLTATVLPADVPNKAVTWTSSNTGTATVDSNGVVTGVAVGSVTITATSVVNSAKSATCSVNVTDESDWEEIAKVAKLVAEDSSINNRTTQVTKDGMTIKVGQEFTLSHDGIKRKVRVLGFNHDILTNPIEAYGTDGVGKISEACRKNIKQVNKEYIETYNDASSVKTSSDKLWLLSCSEIWANGRTDLSAKYGMAVAKEGEQYQFYYAANPDATYTLVTQVNPEVVKKDTAGKAISWYLRSPRANDNEKFCCVSNNGSVGSKYASAEGYIFPGFCL